MTEITAHGDKQTTTKYATMQTKPLKPFDLVTISCFSKEEDIEYTFTF